jgi:hypothetical protein
MLKIAVVDPSPSASVTIAAQVKAVLLLSER